MKKSLLFMLLFLPFSQNVFSSEYRVELGASAQDYDEEGVEVDFQLLNANIYLLPVSNHKGPYAEAAYLSRASYISIVAGSLDGDDDLDGDIRDFAMTYIAPGSNIIFGFERDVIEFEVSNREEKEEKDTSVTVGMYLSDAYSAKLTYTDRKLTEKYLHPWLLTYSSKEHDVGIYDLGIKNLVETNGNAKMALAGDIIFYDGDDGNAHEIKFGSTVYPTRSLGFGIDLGYFELENNDSATQFNILAEYYLTPSFALGAQLGRKNGDASRDLKTIELDIAARF